jgi:formate dehydrogenase subunit gamma
VTTPTPAPLGPAAQGRVQALLAEHGGRAGALLPLLHAVQDALGHVPAAAVPLIAHGLNLSRAEVHGVLAHYPHFRSTPAGRHLIQVCRAESCLACGAEALLAHAEARLGCKLHETRADGAFSLEPVYCLGLCAMSPAIQVGDQQYARMTAQGFDRLAAQLEAAP